MHKCRNAAVISRLLVAWMTRICSPMVARPPSNSRNVVSVTGRRGINEHGDFYGRGHQCRSSSSRFAANLSSRKN